MLPNATIVIILHYFSLTNQYTVHFKLTQCYVNYITIKRKKGVLRPPPGDPHVGGPKHTQRKAARHTCLLFPHRLAEVIAACEMGVTLKVFKHK